MITCMNCMKSVSDKEMNFFAECLLCPNCFGVATRIYDQSQLELKQLLITLKELLRTAIVQHQLTFTPSEKVDGAGYTVTPTAVETLSALLRSQPCQPEPTSPRTSTSTTPLLAAGVGGQPSSSSTVAQDSKSETPSTATQPTENSASAENVAGTS